MSERIPVWAQHTNGAGRVAIRYLGAEPDSSMDCLWIDAETARRWAAIDAKNSNDMYRLFAGRTVLEYLTEGTQ